MRGLWIRFHADRIRFQESIDTRSSCSLVGIRECVSSGRTPKNQRRSLPSIHRPGADSVRAVCCDYGTRVSTGVDNRLDGIHFGGVGGECAADAESRDQLHDGLSSTPSMSVVSCPISNVKCI